MGIEHVELTINPIIIGHVTDFITPLFPWQFKGIALMLISG